MPTRKWSQMQEEAAKAEPLGFKELDEGIYHFVIKEAGEVREYNGDEQISVRVTVEQGPRAGATMFHNFRLPDDPSILRIVFEQFNALGLGEDFFKQDPSTEQVAKSLAGRRFVATVVHKKAKDYETSKKVYVNLNKFSPPVGPAPVGSGGPGGVPTSPSAGPASPGMPPQPFAQQPAPAQPQAPQAAPAAPQDPWAAQPQAPQAPQDPWASQPPAQQQAAPAQPQQTWQPPASPPL